MADYRRVGMLVWAIVALSLMLACLPLSRDEEATEPVPETGAPTPTAATEPTSPSPTPTMAAVGAPGRILPSDLHYQGAFRLPDTEDDLGWTWSGHALAYHPEGDPSGPEDGYPGSLFGTGNDQKQFVSEIGIPGPVRSEGKDLEALHTAQTLQPFADIRGSLYDGLEEMGDLEGALPKVGLAVLPPQGSQESHKLHFCWGYHLQQVPQDEPTLHGQPEASHGQCELDLSDPRLVGAWTIGDYINFVTNDYLLPVDPAWAAAHAPGMLLATGRFRDGGQGSQGPSLLLYSPWNVGNAPSHGTQLEALALLAYSNILEEGGPVMDGYSHADEWSGGAWLTSGERAAVVFVGTKALGETWYGFADGTVWPEEGPYPPVPDPPNDERGWWADEFAAQVLFYDVGDLAAVARSEKLPSDPQPYAHLDLRPVLYGVTSPQQWHQVGAVAFDRARGLLYVLEPLVDEDKSIVHVWKVG